MQQQPNFLCHLITIPTLMQQNIFRNQAISTNLKTIEANPKIQSVILTSSKPSIFSAGLDIQELVAPDPNRLPKFWNSMQQVCLDLYGSRLATVAALQGHAIAGGCMLAMACDYRVMYAGDCTPNNSENGQSDKKKKQHIPTIGLNETKLGIAAPPWMGQLMVNTIGFRPTEWALALGTLFSPKDALNIGLVDAVVEGHKDDSNSNHDDVSNGILQQLLPPSLHDQIAEPVIQNAFQEALTFAKIPPQARWASKQITRSQFLMDMEAKRDVDREHFCGFITLDAVQKNLGAYVEALKKRSKK